MGLTKTEKDFWIRELTGELEKKRENYSEEILECEEIARLQVVEENGWGDLMGAIMDARNEAENIYANYLEAADAFKVFAEDLDERVRAMNIHSRYGGRQGFDTSYPIRSYPSKRDVNFSFLDLLIEEKLPSVLADNDLQVVLNIDIAIGKVERSIMLATTSAQLSAFLEEFCAANGLEL